MKKIAFFFSFILLLFVTENAIAQTTNISQRLATEYVKKAKPIIIGCCSSYPKNIESEYISHRALNNGRILIQMNIRWVSDTYTNCHVEVEGELTVDRNGCNPSWLYKDSTKNIGCFIRPGCRWTCSSYFSECL